jgi:hypothetical protein
MPMYLGNTEQVLLRGVVCSSCNNFFGRKIEPALFKDPVIHTMCAMYHIVNSRTGKIIQPRLFGRHYIPVDIPHLTPELDLKIRSDGLELAVVCKEAGVRDVHCQVYKRKDVALFSRAIHKVAFESLVHYQMTSEPKIPNLDLFAELFEPIRQWVRYGQPQGKVRPLARRVATPITREWQPLFRRVDQHLAVELRLYADWFYVSLTSTHNQVEEHLRQWYSGNAECIWLIADSYGPLSAGSGEPA